MVTVTTIFVPIVQATFEGSLSSVSTRTWLACFLALLGIGVMGLDLRTLTEEGAISPSLFSHLHPAGFTRGDLCIVGAAFLYTMHVVRLESWANRMSPLRLAGSKSLVQAFLAIGLVLVLLSVATATGEAPISSSASLVNGIFAPAQEAGREISGFFDTFSKKVMSGELTPLALSKIAGAITWSGLIGTAYVLYAQSLGQRYVRPSDANLVYSLQPIFTSLFAYILLGETMEGSGYLGGAIILSAVYLVASKSMSSTDEKVHSE